jgi:hypothetical protein
VAEEIVVEGVCGVQWIPEALVSLPGMRKLLAGVPFVLFLAGGSIFLSTVRYILSFQIAQGVEDADLPLAGLAGLLFLVTGLAYP